MALAPRPWEPPANLFPPRWVFKIVAKLDGLPKGHDKVTTFGQGGGRPIKIKHGPLAGWYVGGGNSSQVYGTSFHPTPPAAMKLPWGFKPIATSLMTNYPPNVELYYQNLPQNMTRPGGELVEMKITPAYQINNVGDLIKTSPFIFVSDNYTASQIRFAMEELCSLGLIYDDTIPFNSTGNILPETVLQYYRGDTAAMVLPGYDNTKEQPDFSDVGPNPPLPLGAVAEAWQCMNFSIGESIPLMHGSPPEWKAIVGGVVPAVCVILCYVFMCCCGDPGPRYTHQRRDVDRRSEAPRRPRVGASSSIERVTGPAIVSKVTCTNPEDGDYKKHNKIKALAVAGSSVFDIHPLDPYPSRPKSKNRPNSDTLTEATDVASQVTSNKEASESPCVASHPLERHPSRSSRESDKTLVEPKLRSPR